MILQHKRTSSGGHHVIPIFYDVDPSDVRWQMGSFKEAFESYEEDEREDGWKSKVEGWKAALREAADLAGKNLQNEANGHEAKFIEKIVEVVQERLRRRVLSMPVYPIGINSRAEFILSWLNDGSRDAVMLAICGMGGLGKTTIAKYVYNQNCSMFQGSSFLADITKVSKQPKGLIDLQTQLLSNIMKQKGERVNNVHEGMAKIEVALKCRRVLLVLDDVETQEQMEAMVGNYDWLHTGSKIIITTRDKQVVSAHKTCVVHRLEILNSSESLELFSHHAFGQNKPDESFKVISERLANQCGGLPLAIKILGSSLSEKSLNIWESQFEKLRGIPKCEIYKILEISFDILDRHDKELFLHIACFFVGYDKDFVVPFFEGCNFYPNDGFENLIDKCLLTFTWGDSCQAEENDKLSGKKLEMHQLLQQMGREIVCRESPKELGNRSRIWDNNDSLHILREKFGTEKIEGFILNIQKSENGTFGGYRKRKFQHAFDWFWPPSTTSGNLCETAFEIEAFGPMRNLKFLVLNYVQLSGNYKTFPKGLRWLCWHGFPLQSIPSDFYLERLVILEMPYSNLRSVWNGAKNLNCLKILNLSDSYNLTKTPDFSLVLNLEQLILENCTSLVEIHQSIGRLEKLVLLNLKNCSKLSKFPRSSGWRKLFALDVSGCTNLEEWPEGLENMESLAVLIADRVGKDKTQHSSMRPWSFKPNKTFRIPLTYLPPSLVKLSLVACNLRDDAFPTDVSKLSSLKYLNLSKNPIRSFPDCFTRLTGLVELELSSCTELRSITKLPTERLNYLNMFKCPLLEKATYLLHPVHYCGCIDDLFIYFKGEAIENADKEIVNNLGLSNWESLGITNIMIYQHWNRRMWQNARLQPNYYGDKEFDRFATFYPGSEIPVRCNFKEKGSSIHLKVPFYDDNIRIQGLNVCFVYAFCGREGIFCTEFFHPRIWVMNKSTREDWDNRVWFAEIPKTSKDMIDLSYWKFNDNDFKSGDILHIRVLEDEVFGRGHFEVKEIGVRILFRELEGKSLHSISSTSKQISTKSKAFAGIRLHQFFSVTESLNVPLKVHRSVCRRKAVSRYDQDMILVHMTYLLESGVPTWCNFRNRGPSIELTVPNNNTKIQGLNVCSIYTFLHHYQDKSMGGFWNNMYKWGIGVTETNQDIMEWSYWKPKYDVLESSDKLHIEVFIANEYFKVKEIGVQIVYEEHGEANDKGKQLWAIGEPCASIHVYLPNNYKFKLNMYVNRGYRNSSVHVEALYTNGVYEGVFRDDEGKWMLGYYECSGKSDLEVRYWAIYKGLTIIWEKGWSNVLIQTDDSLAVELFHNITSDDWRAMKFLNYSRFAASTRMMTNDILFLRSRCNCTLSYIIPERNKLAKLTAELGKISDNELLVLENPPDGLEIKGISFL